MTAKINPKNSIEYMRSEIEKLLGEPVDFEVHEWYNLDRENDDYMLTSNINYFKTCLNQLVKVNRKVNDLFDRQQIPLKNKVYMNLGGRLFLFGKPIGRTVNSNRLLNIINSTPKEQWDFVPTILGHWVSRETKAKLDAMPRPAKNNVKSIFDEDE